MKLTCDVDNRLRINYNKTLCKKCVKQNRHRSLVSVLFTVLHLLYSIFNNENIQFAMRYLEYADQASNIGHILKIGAAA